MTYNAKPEFPAILQDRWPFYVEKNGETPIQSFAHRVGLLTRLDLRPILPEISTEILLIQGREDRVVPRRDFDLLESALPKAHGMIVPTAGHILHLTHAELLANLIGDWLLPCAPEGCPREQTDGPGCACATRGRNRKSGGMRPRIRTARRAERICRRPRRHHGHGWLDR